MTEEPKHTGGYFCSTRKRGDRLIIGTVEVTVLGFPKSGHVIIGIRNDGPKIDIERLPPTQDWKDGKKS